MVKKNLKMQCLDWEGYFLVYGVRGDGVHGRVDLNQRGARQLGARITAPRAFEYQYVSAEEARLRLSGNLN